MVPYPGKAKQKKDGSPRRNRPDEALGLKGPPFTQATSQAINNSAVTETEMKKTKKEKEKKTFLLLHAAGDRDGGNSRIASCVEVYTGNWKAVVVDPSFPELVKMSRVP